MGRDLYAVLGVPRNATTRQIRERFRQLVRERHPDRYQGDEKRRAEEEFQEITQAVNVLSDAEKRRRHDLDLARPGASTAERQEQASRVYLQRGIKAYKERNWAAAVEAFEKVVRDEPGNAQAWHLMARARRHHPRGLERATAAAGRAAELDPINPSYLHLAGELYAASGQPERAVKLFDRALRWGGEDEEIEAARDEARRALKKGRGFFGKIG